MDKRTRALLLGINQQFYQKTARTFDQSRQSSWPGWQKLLPWIKTLKEPITVLDLACGNGRWGQFLLEAGINVGNYTGIDQNEELLLSAQTSLKTNNLKLIKQDISNLQKIPYTADLVAAMGWLHHLPGKQQRLLWLKKSFDNVSPGGLFIVSFWQLGDDSRQITKIIPWKTVGLDETDVEADDFLLDWQNSGIPRYCHHFGKQELREYENLKIMEKIDEFEADGKTGKLNRYMVFRKRKSE